MSSPAAANTLLNDGEHMSHAQWLNLSVRFPLSAAEMNGHVFTH